LSSQVHGTVGVLEWGVSARAFPGETSSGDVWLVKDVPGGALVAVVDALGHGGVAAPIARKAADTLEQFAHEPLPSLLRRCHEALLGTRGAVMSLASFAFADSTITWLGVGNVEGVILFADPGVVPRHTTLVTRGGIVGAELPGARPSVLPLAQGDTLVLTTDGVRPGFADGHTAGRSAQHLADEILAKFAKEHDDALVLAVRYLGGS
jgi:negative regulator of sigma-B (phosphoserine phosphatase)